MTMPMGLICAAALAANPFKGAWITDAEMATLTPKRVYARQLERKNLPPPDPKVQNRHVLFRKRIGIHAVLVDPCGFRSRLEETETPARTVDATVVFDGKSSDGRLAVVLAEEASTHRLLGGTAGEIHRVGNGMVHVNEFDLK